MQQHLSDPVLQGPHCQILTWVSSKSGTDVGHPHVLVGGLHLWQVVQPDRLTPQALAKVHNTWLRDGLGLHLQRNSGRLRKGVPPCLAGSVMGSSFWLGV